MSFDPDAAYERCEAVIGKLCAKHGVRLLRLNGFGPFALPVYWRRNPPLGFMPLDAPERFMHIRNPKPYGASSS